MNSVCPLNQYHNDYTISEAEIAENQEGTFYEVELRSPDGKEIELIFDQDGNFIKIEVEDDD
ncbi:MAG: PepSY-like domain-containing protein [Bacteroidales bacterium]|nr:PepSY-like domain-containing protein [Bacteroidales bacterium]